MMQRTLRRAVIGFLLGAVMPMVAHGQGPWTKTFLPGPVGHMGLSPSVVIDSSGVIHLSFITTSLPFVRNIYYPTDPFYYLGMQTGLEATALRHARVNGPTDVGVRLVDTYAIAPEAVIESSSGGQLEIAYAKGFWPSMCTNIAAFISGVWVPRGSILPSYCLNYFYYGERHPVIRRDRAGRDHLAFQGAIVVGGQTEILYRETDQNGAWSARVNISNSPGSYESPPSLDVAPNGITHMVYLSLGQSNDSTVKLMYASGLNTVFGPPVQLLSMKNSYGGGSSAFAIQHRPMYMPAIVVDGSGDCHVVFSEQLLIVSQFQGSPAIVKSVLSYVTNASGTWSTPVRLSDTAIWGNASIAVDVDGKLHVAAERRDTAAGSDYDIYYLNNRSGSWGLPQDITRNTADEFMNAGGNRFLAVMDSVIAISYYTFEPDTARPSIGLLTAPLCTYPQITARPDTVDFGRVPLGLCDDTLVTIAARPRAGAVNGYCSKPLTVQPLSIIGRDSARFRIVAPNSTFQLSVNDSVTRRMEFCPRDTGCYTAQVVVRASIGLDTITLRACGMGPRLELRPRRVTFDSVAIGTCRDTSFTIANIGGDTLHTGRSRLIGGRDTTWFRIISPVDSSHLRALQTRAGRIRFCPLDTGCFSLRLVVGSQINNDTIEVVGCAIPPRPTITPDTIDLGNLPVGVCRDTTVTVRNSGGGWLLTPGAISVGALQVSITPPDSLRVAPGGSTTLRLRWCPPDTGCVTGRLVVKTVVGDRVVFLRGCAVAPRIISDPTEIDFGGVPVDSCREASVVLRNDGSYVLEIGSGSLGGTPGVTMVSPTQWPQRLQPGESLSVVVRYCPTTIDTLNEALTLINDSRNSPVHVVRVKGYGARGMLSLPSRIDFGVVPIGTCHDTVVVARNSGNAAMDLDGVVVRQVFGDRGFSVAGLTSVPRRLAPGDTVQLRLRYCPVATTGDRDSLGIASRPTTRGTELVGRGTRGTLVSDGLQIDFGDVELGTCRRDSVHLRNIGSVTVRLLQGDLTAIGGGAAPGSMRVIAPISYPIDVAAGKSLTVIFEYCPTSEVSDSALWRGGVENDPDGITVELHGRGVRSGIEVMPDTVEFGCTEPGRVIGRAVDVRNVGSRPLVIQSYRVTTAGSPYIAPSGRSITVPVGAGRIDSVYYVPPAIGEYIAELEVTTDAGTRRVVLHGRSGRDTALRLTPDDVSFGTIGEGDTGGVCIEIWNITCDTVTITGITTSGRGYLLSGDDGSQRTLAPGDRDTVCVAFAPDTVGGSDGRLQVDAGLRSGSVGLHGTGAPAGVVVRPRTMDFGRVDVGGSIGPRDATVFNQGLVDLDAVNWRVTGANPGDFTAPPFIGSVSLGAFGRDTLRLALSFFPTARGVRTARLEVDVSSGATVGVELRGFGDELNVTADPLVVDAGRVATGSTATLVDTIQLRGSGTRLGRITGIRLTGPDSVYFMVTGITVSDVVDTSMAARATVAFTPDAVRHYSAQWIAEVDSSKRGVVDLMGEGIGGRQVRLVLDTVRAYVGDRFILRGRLVPGLTVEEKAEGWRVVLQLNPKSLYPHGARDAGGSVVAMTYDADGRIELTSGVEVVGSDLFALELEGLASGERTNLIDVTEATLDGGSRSMLQSVGLVELEGCDIDRGVGFDRRARIVGVRPQPVGGEGMEVMIAGGTEAGVRLRLVDILGRVVVEEGIPTAAPVGGAWRRFDIGTAASGIYLLQVIDGGWVDAVPVVVGR